MRTFHHLTYEKRKTLEAMLKAKYPVKEIAFCLGVSQSTVYREIKKGQCEIMRSDLVMVEKYDADFADQTYRENLKQKGKVPKILLDEDLRAYIKYLVKDESYSPEAILSTIKANDVSFDQKVQSYTTIYSAIKRGYIKGLRISDLPRGKYKKRLPKDRTRKRKAAGKSIEQRKPDILTREEFGHWEMDSVIGKVTNRKTVLVLTERKTRYEIVEKMREHTAEEVVRAMNRIEKRYKSAFYDIFKTITMDNGSEFSDSKGIEKALFRVGNRTETYYCHPNSPNERGSNENNNILIRRFLPKGTDFDQEVTTKKVKRIEDWMNTYPRGILGGRSSEEVFIEELQKIGISYDY